MVPIILVDNDLFFIHQSDISLPQLTDTPSGLLTSPIPNNRQAISVGESTVPSMPSKSLGDEKPSRPDTSGLSDDDALQARLDALRRN